MREKMYYKEKRKMPLVFESLKVCLKWKFCFKYNINRHQSLFIILLVIKVVENVSISIKFINVLPGKEKSLIVIIVKKRNIESTKTDFFFIIFANINFRDLVITKNFANIYFREFIHNSRNSRKLMIAKINDLKVAFWKFIG